MSQRDSYGRHELLDRTHLIMEMIQDHILDHGGIKAKERDQAKRAIGALWWLYQEIGRTNGKKVKKTKPKRRRVGHRKP